MRRMLLGLLAASSAMALASAASAADLRLKAPPAPMPMMNWSGFYVGAHIGGTWGTTETEIHSIALGPLALAGFTLPLSSHAFNGFVGGGQIGYNWQSGIVVFGVEGEVSATNARGTGPCVLVLSCKTEQNWVATAAARLGLADGPSLYYVKGGAAWSNNTYSADLNILLGLHTEVQQTRTGWLVGAGIEHAFAGTGLSAKLEYDFIDYGTKDVHFPLAVIVPIDIGAQAREYQHVVKVGVNYRFDYLGWGKGKAPVVAKY